MTFSNVKHSLILSSLSIICCVCLRARYRTIWKVKCRCFEAARSRSAQMTINSEKMVHCLVLGFFVYVFWHGTDAVSLWFTDEQEAVQKRTFTKWINSHLAKVGESVSIPTANCQPLYCPLTQTQAPVFGDGKVPRPAACSCVALPCLMWLGSKKPCRAGHGTDCAS